MYKLLLLFLFSTIVTAQEAPIQVMDRNISATYPYAYAALGNVIYGNAPKIQKLEDINEYVLFKEKIENYIKAVENAKKEGFTLNESSTEEERTKYLEMLRKLAITNDFFIRSAKDKYALAIEQGNSELFLKLLNSGIIDIQKHKQEILDYYQAHQESIDPTGVIQKLLDEEKKAKESVQTVEHQIKYKSKRAREIERIRWIREKDKREQQKLEKKLQDELERKKLEIREYQKKELSKTK